MTQFIGFGFQATHPWLTMSYIVLYLTTLYTIKTQTLLATTNLLFPSYSTSGSMIQSQMQLS